MLTAQEVKSISCPPEKNQIKKSDGKGLFILVKSNNSKLWRLRYKYAGKHQEMALGGYPTISLSEARRMAEEARLSLIQGVNPMDERRERKRASNPEDRGFGVIALKWWEQQKDSWSADHAARVRRWIQNDAKKISELAIDEIDAGHITELMLFIEGSGSPKKAPVILSVINRIFGYALAHRLTRTNPAQGLPLRDIIKPLPKVRHRAAIINPNELAELITDIDGNNSGSFCTSEALKLIPRLFLRPKEIRHLKWEYIDFEHELIRIPEEEMKRRREHLVPLAAQVIQQLQEIQKVTGYSEYVFPGERDSSRPISKNVMTNRLRALGYAADVMSTHGFRSSASTILHEQGWDHDVIEVQLAHLTGTATSRAYNRSIYLSKRTKMMQEWANYLDNLKLESKRK
ncbi:Putative prophage CPS-53 integrase [Marinomonas gallaica]|uniref:Prophage CPS-53 integrase n=1 Tax=Marinomonas gallaica TaxID=1806667 RepID=A0A1C3JR84_9GAMM|nr:tyrosine-type recombinase/integrase [Marinomonas gallaica]SBT17714.1 Putative prophage CPS-53 integrase [Marinomonas gallaica]SBT20040.1 Putative prophage CPS-53 integrase [Marinomonas gallaica]